MTTSDHTSGNDKANFVQVEWYCNKCDAKHFGNCPLIKITTTATSGNDKTGRIGIPQHADNHIPPLNPAYAKSPTPEPTLQEQIRKCFKDTYMETEGETELFDTEETIAALVTLIEKAERKARIDTLNEVMAKFKEIYGVSE